jgi:hypothetical protein
VQAADVVITMGCGDACPIFPGKHERTGSATPRRTKRIEAFLAELVPPDESAAERQRSVLVVSEHGKRPRRMRR